MVRTSTHLANRIGFIVLGLTNNFAYVIMLSAAFDLLNQTTSSTHSQAQSQSVPSQTQAGDSYLTIDLTSSTQSPLFSNITNSTTSLSSSTTTTVKPEQYCNEHSTSTILLADTLPSLATKLLYPFLLVGLPTSYKAIATAILSAAAFVITGVTKDQVLIFTGVICASFSSGLGESTYISNTHLYGDSSLSGWSIGTGGAGLFGAFAYAVLRMMFPIKVIMFIMLIVPLAMMLAFFCIIKPVGDDTDPPHHHHHHHHQQQQQQATRASSGSGRLDSQASQESTGSQRPKRKPVELADVPPVAFVSASSSVALDEQEQPIRESAQVRDYGAKLSPTDRRPLSSSSQQEQQQQQQPFDLRAKVRHLPSLAKYFMPLLLVYFAEYFINQGLFELVYYPEITSLKHPDQYRWFQVSYQLGVFISRSSLDFLQIKNIWTMSLLQAANAILFLAHASKLIHLPSFYIVIALIIYEGLLGGFTYVNTFYRIKKEVIKERQEFCMSTVTIADSLGIVFAGLVALPVHDALCKLYV